MAPADHRKIIAVAEVYDTLTASDTYRTKMSSFEALRELRRVAGTQLDARYVEVLASLLVSAGLVLMVVTFDAPIVYMLGLAFWDKGRGFTLEHYQGLIETPVYLRVLGNTMRIALIATLANVLIGYPLAHWMRGLQNRARLAAIVLVVLPFWVSILVRTYAWIVVLGNGASGKSTFARDLAAATGIEAVELDTIFWSGSQ